jgi:signal transduction histidine kinase
MRKLSRVFDFHSISLKLYLIIVPATALSILLVSYFDIYFAARRMDGEIQRQTRSIADVLGLDIANLNPQISLDTLRSFLNQIREANFYITRIDVFRKAGDQLSLWISTSSTSGPGPIHIDENSAMNGGHPLEMTVLQDRERCWKVIVPYVNQTGSVQGCVTVYSSLSASDLVTRVHDEVDLVLIPVSIAALIFILHFLFTRTLTGRIGKLGHAMDRARQGDLTKRAPVDQPDELGTIARIFNETMDEIQRSSEERNRLLEEQKGFNLQLQDRVHEATEGLSNANTQLMQVNQDLIDTQRRLTRYERMAIAGQMAAAFAHEVGSPMSAITTHLELLAEDPHCNDDARNRIRLIQEQLNRITGFVEDLLSETRAAAQVFERVQINEVLKQLLLFLHQHLERHNIEVATSFQADLPEIEANAQQLQQVFLNLFNNAADAMPQGGRIRVETRVEEDEMRPKQVAVSVSDNGVGIDSAEQKRIFEPFFSTKDFRRGTGLGLSIAARIVRQHGGTIGLQSEPGVGTTFTLRFPFGQTSATFPQEGAE